jgi:long-chain fatty acid transport protein
LYVSHKVSKKFTVGFGLYTPYGSTAKWDEDWEGRYLIQDISLKAFYFQPTVSYQLNEKLGIGLGLIYATGDVTIHKALPYNSQDVTGQLELKGKTANYGFNAGIFYKATDKLNIGLDYRSKITMKLRDGDATFTTPEAIHQQGIPEDNKFDADLPMPANFDVGVSYQATEKLLVALELNWVVWNVYDSLSFKFKESGEKLNSSNPRKYHDSFIPRLGLQYRLCDKIQLRAGVYYDATPTNKDYFNPETTSLNTIAFSLGMTYCPMKNLGIDVSYLQLNGLEEERSYEPGNFTGTYKVTNIIPGIGIHYNL